MNEYGKRKVQDGAPLDFVPKRWEKHVYDDAINRAQATFSISWL